MTLKFANLKLHRFRNYGRLELEFPSGVVAIYGDNGQGKTNLIEALHLLLRGESFRPVTSASFESQDGHHGKVLISGRLVQQDLTHDVALEFNEGKKSVTWNTNRVTAGNLARQFPVVLFSPESLSAIKSGPDLRRQLVDDVLVLHSAGSVKILKDFKRVLRTRNRVLKEMRDGVTPRLQALAVLESLDPIYLPLAAELTLNRVQALKSLHSDFERTTRGVLDAGDVDISVDYLISGQKADSWNRSDLLSAMHKRAMELRTSEMESGTSLVGPHKHDIRFLFTGKDSRFFCSQGQQRALILSFKMAQILYHYRSHQVYPFLLLDDVLSELDLVRRANLVSFLKDIPAQIFLTTTDISFLKDFGDHRLNVFRVHQGTVQPE